MTTFLFFWDLERSVGQINFVTTDLLNDLYVSNKYNPAYCAVVARYCAI